MRLSRALLTVASILTVVLTLVGPPSPAQRMPTVAAADTPAAWVGSVTFTRSITWRKVTHTPDEANIYVSLE